MIPNLTITRIQNGFIVSIPKHSKRFDYDAQTKELSECADKHYIPTYSNIRYFETLEKCLEFIKSIESNMPMENYSYGNAPVINGTAVAY